MLNREKGAPPLYHQLKEILKQEIEEEKYKKGDSFLTERQLQEKYDVSRVTVRQAVSELVNEGYLQSSRGVGTTVVFSKIDENLKQVISFSEEMGRHGITMMTSHCVMSRERAGKIVAKNLRMKKDCYCYRLERVRCAQNIPVVYSITWLTNKYHLPIDNYLYKDSLYKLLQEEYSIVIAGGRDTFEAVLATEVIGKFLNITPGQPVFKRIRSTYDQDNDVLEYTICYYPGERYKYSVEL